MNPIKPVIYQPKTMLPRFDITIKGTRLALSERTYVMGVLNVTPDSFSDGGLFFNTDKAIEYAIGMARDGADIIDVGGESTRPGADDVGLDAELNRVIPVIEGIRKRIDIPISIDTRKAKVAEKAIQCGACIVNDVSGLKFDSKMAGTIAQGGVAAILMHSAGTPKTMQLDPKYANLIDDIIASLKESIAIAKQEGVNTEKIIVDPGIGFGKTVEHNLEILKKLSEFKALGRPVCVGTSRKSFIGRILGVESDQGRLAGTIATSVVAITNGASMIRVHDVKEMVAASRIVDKILKG